MPARERLNLAADFTVRPLQAHDLSVLKTVLPEWAPEALDATGSTHHHRVLVHTGKANDELAGVAEFQLIVDEGHLLGIAIVPALQGRGLGLQLLQAVLGEMRAAGCTRCLLEVRKSNVAAQALYQRARFTLDGVRKDYYPPSTSAPREDALLYSLAL